MQLAEITLTFKQRLLELYELHPEQNNQDDDNPPNLCVRIIEYLHKRLKDKEGYEFLIIYYELPELLAKLQEDPEESLFKEACIATLEEFALNLESWRAEMESEAINTKTQEASQLYRLLQQTHSTNKMSVFSGLHDLFESYYDAEDGIFERYIQKQNSQNRLSFLFTTPAYVVNETYLRTSLKSALLNYTKTPDSFGEETYTALLKILAEGKKLAPPQPEDKKCLHSLLLALERKVKTIHEQIINLQELSVEIEYEQRRLVR